MLSEEFEATFNSISSKLKSEEEFEREAKVRFTSIICYI